MKYPALILNCFYLSICVTYSFIHVLYLQAPGCNKKQLFSKAALSIVVMTFFSSIAQIIKPTFLSFFFLFFSIFSYLVIFRTAPFSTITGSFISYGLVYCIRAIASLILPLLVYYIPVFSNDYVALTLQFILSFSIIILVFRIRRLSHGLPFINDPLHSDTGSVLSILIYMTVIMLKTAPATGLNYIYLLISLMCFALYISLWIRKAFKRKYVDILKNNDLNRLEQEKDEVAEELRKIKNENERLSAIIHKDNKLMASMLLSVKALVYKVSDEDDAKKRKQECSRILAQLEEASGSRSELIRNYEHSGRRLPETGSSRIDSLLAYMNQRAFSEKIHFEVALQPKFMEAVQFKITTEDLATLMADLIENAIIAIRGQEQKNILVSLQAGSRPVLAVYDSGVPFPEEVKRAWGKERVTMHKDTGGSGIGMMTTYEICNKIQADFLIEEHPPVALYTKCISVTFPAGEL